VGPLIK